jgi:hypothetical protein
MPDENDNTDGFFLPVPDVDPWPAGYGVVASPEGDPIPTGFPPGGSFPGGSEDNPEGFIPDGGDGPTPDDGVGDRPEPEPEFLLRITPHSANVLPGATATSMIHVRGTGAVSGHVILTLQSVPFELRDHVTLAPEVLSVSSGVTSRAQLTVSVPGTMSLGSYAIWVDARRDAGIRGSVHLIAQSEIRVVHRIVRINTGGSTTVD